jgi:predicted AlkP superfamily phosphohydrolase/phosphomutase
MRREEAYDGPFVEDAPEIVFDQRPGVHTSGAIGTNPVFADAGQWDAENVRTGLFLADGPAVEATDIDGPISITDVAPTILHSVDCAVPTDVDGTPLALFGGREVKTCEPLPFDAATDTAREDVQDRLEDLGYLE